MNFPFAEVKYAGLVRRALISPCGRYRWWLSREWETGGNGKTVCFVMLNPSTADGQDDDPTIRRCIGFVRAWGYSKLIVRNLFAYRATDPSELRTAKDPEGGVEGTMHLLAATPADVLILAWGAGVLFQRDKAALAMFRGTPLFCLGITKFGYPRHPLYVKGDARLVLFNP